jgi:hypothetical protein
MLDHALLTAAQGWQLQQGGEHLKQHIMCHVL